MGNVNDVLSLTFIESCLLSELLIKIFWSLYGPAFKYILSKTCELLLLITSLLSKSILSTVSFIITYIFF